MKKRSLYFFCVLFLLYMLCLPVGAAEEAHPAEVDGGEDVAAESEAFLRSVTDTEGNTLAPTDGGYLLFAESGTAYTLTVDAYAERYLILAIAGNHGINTITLAFSEDGQD